MVNSNNTLGKTLVKDFVYNDAYTNRSSCNDDVIVYGRKYKVYGTKTATTMYGRLYDKSSDVEPLKYFLQVGVAKQSPFDDKFDEEKDLETAVINSLINPVITIELDKEIDETSFNVLCNMYINSTAKTFLETPTEREFRLSGCLKLDDFLTLASTDYENIKTYGYKSYER